MNQTEVESKLIEDIIEIYDAASLWKFEKELTRAEKKNLIINELNLRNEKGISMMIKTALDSSPQETGTIGYLTKDFLTNIMSMLRYRSEWEEEPDKIDPVSPEISIDAAGSLKKTVDFVSKMLFDPGDSTVIDYRVLKEIGSQAKLKEILRNSLNKDNVIIEVIPTSPGNYREKVRYCGHSIWILTPMLPIVKVSIDKS